MFPESKWIPYRLQWVDLSHNKMPVLTKELLIGTKHLRHLNVSANMLNDVRDGVISNLTALEVLDISHNFLTDKVRTKVARVRLASFEEARPLRGPRTHFENKRRASQKITRISCLIHVQIPQHNI